MRIIEKNKIVLQSAAAETNQNNGEAINQPQNGSSHCAANSENEFAYKHHIRR